MENGYKAGLRNRLPTNGVMNDCHNHECPPVCRSRPALGYLSTQSCCAEPANRTEVSALAEQGLVVDTSFMDVTFLIACPVEDTCCTTCQHPLPVAGMSLQLGALLMSILENALECN